MTNAVWFVVIGTLLILMGMRSLVLQRLNLTPSMVYLSVGVLLGPSVFGVFHFNPLKQAHLLEVLAELAVLLSLFIAGTKMPVPFSWKAWHTPLRLAFISMTSSVALTAAFGYYLLGWFGVRGIGSLYYLMFAVVFGLPEELALELIHITLVVVVLSIIIHGLTVKPMMTRWWSP